MMRQSLRKNSHCQRHENQRGMSRIEEVEKMKLAQEVTDKKALICELQAMATGVAGKLSQHDRDLVEERIRDTEHTLGNIEANIQNRLQRYGLLDSELSDVTEQAEHCLTWINQCRERIMNDQSVWSEAKEVDIKLEELKNLRLEISQKLHLLNMICRKVQALSNELPLNIEDNVEKLITKLHSRYNELSQLVDDRCHKVEEVADEWRKFDEKLEILIVWMKEKKTVADTDNILRLSSSEVDKQLDKCKSLTVKVKNQTSGITDIKTTTDSLRQHCNDEGKHKIDDALQELFKQHENLLLRLKQQESSLRGIACSRKRFEADCQKIDRWCRETEMECNEVLQPDCAVEVLNDKLTIYKKHNKIVQDFNLFVTETKQLGEGFFPALFEDDIPVLQQKLEMLHDQFSRVQKLVQSQTDWMENIIKAHSHVQEQVTQCEQWLNCLQVEIKQANVPTGGELKDAALMLETYEGIAKTLEDKHSIIKDLNSYVVKLKADGQFTQADNIIRLTNLYEVFSGQVQRQIKICSDGVAQHQAFLQYLVELETVITECDCMVSDETLHGLPMIDHRVKYKTALEKLHCLKPGLIVAIEKAGQIGKQGTENVLKGKVDILHQKAQALKTHIQDQLARFETVQKENMNFDAEVTEIVSWFQKKEDILTKCTIIPLDVEKFNNIIEKYKKVSAEAADKLQSFKERIEIMNNQFKVTEGSLLQDISEKMKQVHAWENSIKAAMVMKEKYLNETHLERKRFEELHKQVSKWLRGAEHVLNYGYDGLDYDNLGSTLNKITDYFCDPSHYHDLLEQMLELSERILPTLDTNDSTTMKLILKNVTRKHSNCVITSQKELATLKEKVDQWQQFQDGLGHMNDIIDTMESEWTVVDKCPDPSPDAVEAHLELVKSFLENSNNSRSEIDSLNDLARHLDRMGSPDSRALINRHIGSVNHRWDQLRSQAEIRLLTLEEIRMHWKDFMTAMLSVEKLLQKTMAEMSDITPDAPSSLELCSQLSSLQEITHNLEQMKPQVTQLQASHLTLQRILPSATFDNYKELFERYERYVEEVKEKTSSIQNQMDIRNNHYAEVDEVIVKMRETLSAFQKNRFEQLVDASDSSGSKLYEQEMSVRWKQAKILETSLKAKYSTMGMQLPFEIQQKFSELRALECEILAAMKEKEQELQYIQEDREKYKAFLNSVISWLQSADMQLQSRIFNIPEAMESHKDLLLTFEDFKTNLNHLRTKGEDIIKHSQNPEEKESVQKTVADVNRQWLSIQAHAASRSRELSEASDLSHAITDVASGVLKWIEQAEAVIKMELFLTDLDKLQDHLNSHRKIHKNIDHSQDKVIALSAMVKQLVQVCQSPRNVALVNELKNRVDAIQTTTGLRLAALEETNKNLENFEKEVGDLKRWIEQTRSHMVMRDASTDLHKQLTIQEVIVA